MKKGISIIVLAITIIILVILTGVIVVNANYMMTDTDLTKLKVDISQIESLMSTYNMRKNGNIDFYITQFDVSTFTEDELQQFSGENIVDNKVQLYVIELDKIDAEASNYGTQKNGNDDRYLYSSVTGKVYYEKGLESEGIRYYYIEIGE